MANPVGDDDIAGAVQQLPWQFYPPSAAQQLLSLEFPLLHSALTFGRGEVDALGGLHLFRADYVEYIAPAHQPPDAVNPRATGADVNPDAALE